MRAVPYEESGTGDPSPTKGGTPGTAFPTWSSGVQGASPTDGVGGVRFESGLLRQARRADTPGAVLRGLERGFFLPPASRSFTCWQAEPARAFPSEAGFDSRLPEHRFTDNTAKGSDFMGCIQGLIWGLVILSLMIFRVS